MKETVPVKCEVKRIAVGSCVSLSAYLLLLALAALLAVRGVVAEGRVGTIVWLLAFAASFAGAKAALWRGSEQALGVVGSAVLFWAMAQALGAVMGEVLEPARSAAFALPVMAGAALAYLTRGGGRKTRKGKRSRRARGRA